MRAVPPSSAHMDGIWPAAAFSFAFSIIALASDGCSCAKAGAGKSSGNATAHKKSLAVLITRAPSNGLSKGIGGTCESAPVLRRIINAYSAGFYENETQRSNVGGRNNMRRENCSNKFGNTFRR